MDVIDQGAATAELFHEAELRAGLVAVQTPAFTGFCLNCGAKVDAPLLYCPDEENACQVDHERRKGIRNRQYYRAPTVR